MDSRTHLAKGCGPWAGALHLSHRPRYRVDKMAPFAVTPSSAMSFHLVVSRGLSSTVLGALGSAAQAQAACSPETHQVLSQDADGR